MLFHTFSRPMALGPLALLLFIAVIFLRRMVKRAMLRRDRSVPEGETMKEMWPEKDVDDKPPPREQRVSRKQLKYAREFLHDDEGGNSPQ